MKIKRPNNSGAALIIVLAFVVLLTGLVVAYFSRTVTDRQVAQGSFNQTRTDQLAMSATDLIITDLKQEIVNGSAATTVGSVTLYTPTSNANMLPMRSGTPGGGGTPIPNLVRRSVNADSIPAPGVTSRASAINSTTDLSANGRSISATRWNKHYLVPRLDPSSMALDATPVTSFTSPDWVFVTSNGPIVTPAPSSVVGRYSYAIYDEGGLLDANVVGYPYATPPPSPTPTPVQTPPVPPQPINAPSPPYPPGTYPAGFTATTYTAQQFGRKGSPVFTDLSVLPAAATTFFPPGQINNVVGWRNYATAKPDGDFSNNFSFNALSGSYYFNYILASTTGFVKTSGNVWNGRSDQSFLNRQELLNLRNSTGFSQNVLQFLGTFSRELNSPSFKSSVLAAPNADFLATRATSDFDRFDGTKAVVGEPLVKSRFPLSRLAWITYKGPSADVYNSNKTPPYDPVIAALLGSGVTLQTIEAGTADNIKSCFGLTFGGAVGDAWTYDHGGTPGGSKPTTSILQLAQLVGTREPDFFELLQATILTGSLGQDTGGGVTGPKNISGADVFPDVHMSRKTHHILSIGAAILDQADPDSFPTRLQYKEVGTYWTTFGVESLPYITQMYPIAGKSPDDVSGQSWATYLLFQLWNPYQNIPSTPPVVRLRLDGTAGLFTGGNNESWFSTNNVYDCTDRTVTLNSVSTFTTPAPLTTANCSPSPTAAPTFTPLPATAPTPSTGGSFVGLRLPDVKTTPTPSPTVPPNKPRLMLQVGASGKDPNPPKKTLAKPFNATMEVDVGSGTWVPYNRFVGINDPKSWITDASLDVRDSVAATGPTAGFAAAFTTAQLTESPPGSYMKADPRSTRFGIFQMNTNPTTSPRIMLSIWPSNSSTVKNGFGGIVGSVFGGSTEVEHVPLRFAAVKYFPATFCINNGASSTDPVTNITDPRTSTTDSRTIYTDNDGVMRAGDAKYWDPAKTVLGSSTPFYTTPKDYQPIILNRPFRSVGELGYAFRDLPWKSLDLFTENSADAGLLDVFSINDGTPVLNGSGVVVGMSPPAVVAGSINLNTRQSVLLKAILTSATWNELDASNTIALNKSETGLQSAEAMAETIVSLSATPFQNKAGLVTQPGVPTILPTPSILPTPAASPSPDNQTVKGRREAVSRSLSSAVQTRTWNLMIDVIAQSGRYPPGETNLAKFIVEGEQRYWVHVAIDRFTGEVIDRQVEVLKE